MSTLKHLSQEEVMQAEFGKPETGGVVFVDLQEPTKREVHVVGYVTARIEVDVWVEVTDDMSDAAILQEALEDACIDGIVERQHLSIEDEEHRKNRRVLRELQERDRQRLEAWQRGEPIR